MSRKKKVLSYGRKFRDKSGRSVRYVYKNRKKIGLVVLLIADVVLPETEAELDRRLGRKYVPFMERRIDVKYHKGYLYER